MELAKVTSRGQITLPLAIRRKLDVKEGDKVVFYEENGKKRECKHEQGAFLAKEKGEYVFGFKTSGEGVFRYREFYLKVTIG